MLERDQGQKDGGRSVRAYILVKGIVQGVGFRPFVHRLARVHGLNGWVLNSTEGVEIEVEGPRTRVNTFVEEISANPPPLAIIHRIDVHRLPPAGYSSFVIATSHEAAAGFPLISPDIATCPDCLAEIFDPGDRRYRYPFTNCTNCGPRFTIVEGTPYDRSKTTMKAFPLCPVCQGEYDDPANRRFHAQPNACPECGPGVWLVAGEDALTQRVRGAEALAGARAALADGEILAVKGLGGFHLACDATNGEAVRRLRQRKRRVEKPFAIMVRDLEAAASLCQLSSAEAQLLSSARRPIVLLERRPESPVAPEVAPHNRRLGVMLPYTPIHHLLLAPNHDARFTALVMTSGNLGEEPIARDNDEALSRLAELADYFLLHDRPIHARCDDSVTQMFEGRETIVRRSRGYVPLPVPLVFPVEPVLACGAGLKNTFCLAGGSYAFLSQHIGDLEDSEETLDFFVESVDHLTRLFDLQPRIIAHDLHPDYLSTRYALSRAASAPLADGSTTIAVQHHHAHIASCLAENGVGEPVIGVAFDGTGYGPDGTIWGGEFLVADFESYRRVAHLRYVPMPGAEAAIKKPYRMALSYLLAAFGDALPHLDFLDGIDSREIEIVKTQLARQINSPRTSSCGRLFDAVAALVGLRGEVNYEGQAAIELERAAADGVEDAYEFALLDGHPLLQIDSFPALRAIVADLLRGEDVGTISARFHNGLANAIAATSARIREETGIDKICLSGGVFQNRLLLKRTLARLQAHGFASPLLHHQVPCNDGGISLGQAVVAAAQFAINRGKNHA